MLSLSTWSGSQDSRSSLSASRGRCAFSLVEVLVGMTIFAIVAAGIFSALVQTTQMKETAARELEASMIMKNEMEHINGLNWQQITALPLRGSFSRAPEGNFYKTRREVATPNPEQREVKLSITWQGPTGRNYTSSLIMLRTQYDV